MTVSNILICKCGKWNRISQNTKVFRRVICWNCGSSILSVASGKSNATIRGEKISSPDAKPAVRYTGSSPHSRGNFPVGLILTGLLAVISIAVSLARAPGQHTVITLPPPPPPPPISQPLVVPQPSVPFTLPQTLPPGILPPPGTSAAAKRSNCCSLVRLSDHLADQSIEDNLTSRRAQEGDRPINDRSFRRDQFPC